MTSYILIEPVLEARHGMVVYVLYLTDAEGKQTERTFLSEDVARTEWAKLLKEGDTSAWNQRFEPRR